jgi:hypothetical protein
MNKQNIFLVFLLILGLPSIAINESSLPDEPEIGRDLSAPYWAAESYSQALDIWKTAEDINTWVSNRFVYDRARAIELSSNQRTKDRRISIHKPSEFFESRAGICVDLARFGVETLRKIDPGSEPKYLMIEFEPIQIDGNTFRLHWLVSFIKGGMKYFFCDSKRPGHIAGPYTSTRDFISEYERYRGREIMAYSELESYRKQRKSQARKAQASKGLNRTNAAER